MNSKKAALAFFFGGLLPVIAFTVIEEKYGTVAGIIAGMVFGVGEILWEIIAYRKVSAITWGGNALILVLGFISLKANEGIWFKLQPSIMEAVFSLVFIGSTLMGRPLLLALSEKQGQKITDSMRAFFPGLNFRIGLFFAAHAALATWAAFYWSTSAWAILKGVGFTLSFIAYMVLEMLWMRRRARG